MARLADRRYQPLGGRLPACESTSKNGPCVKPAGHDGNHATRAGRTWPNRKADA